MALNSLSPHFNKEHLNNFLTFHLTLFLVSLYATVHAKVKMGFLKGKSDHNTPLLKTFSGCLLFEEFSQRILMWPKCISIASPPALSPKCSTLSYFFLFFQPVIFFSEF